MKNPMYTQEDILRKAEEFRTGNIHEAANRYFSGNMSAGELQAFDSVMIQNPDLREEVRLQGFAMRSARVAGRVQVREKLARASERAKQRNAIRSRQKLRRTLVQVAAPTLAACLVIAMLIGQGGWFAKPQAVHFADVNSFGVLYAPHSASGVIQANVFQIEGKEAGFVKLPGSFRIRPVPMANLSQYRESDSTNVAISLLNDAREDISLRWALCDEMRNLGLAVQDPIHLQNRRWEAEVPLQLKEMDKSGYAMNYPPLTGFLAEEDPGLNQSTLTIPSQNPISASQEAESARITNDLDGRFWESLPFEV
jgi:hypothetical protein